jgi:hypothetical protein
MPFLFNADQPPQGLVTVQFSERGLETHVSQGNPQQQDSPQDMDRVVVAAAAAVLAEHFEQVGIWDGSEKRFNRAQAGTVLQAIPSEQGLGHSNVHGGPP